MFKKLFSFAAALAVSSCLPAAANWDVGTHEDDYGRKMGGDNFIYYNERVGSLNSSSAGASIKVECVNDIVSIFVYPVNFAYEGITEYGTKYGFMTYVIGDSEPVTLIIGIIGDDVRKFAIFNDDFIEVLRNNKLITFKFPAARDIDPVFKFDLTEFNKIYNRGCK